MMARLKLRKTSLVASLALAFFLVTTQVSGLPDVVPASRDPAGIVKTESHPVLLRQKREWIWNSHFVQEDKPPSKFGQLRSTKNAVVKKYRIDGEGANTIFIVDEKGALFFTKALDREKKALYHLTARMYDGNNMLIEDAGDFVVQVMDINDNKPEFHGEYKTSIDERSKIGTHVIETKAFDADEPGSVNSELRYSLTNDGDVSTFQIDPTSGNITVRTNTLDREDKSQYVLVVKAQDMGGRPTGSTATTTVTITLTDVNDNLVSFATKKYDLSVREDFKLSEGFGTLRLLDKDEIANKQPVFSIKGENEEIFNVTLDKNKDGSVVLKKALDFEAKSSYTFTVKVTENIPFTPDNINRAITTAQVQVRVLDVDEPPVFSQSSYTFKVLEEKLVKQVGAIKASDPDSANRGVRYSIMDDNSPFDINPFTGLLSTRTALDRELKPRHTFQVRAEEEESGLESFVNVTIIVEDINDNEPELDADDMFVCENDGRNTIIGTLRGLDKDEQVASFTFSLENSNSNFSIRDFGNNTAALLVKQGPFSLDDPTDYSVDVRLSDGGKPAQSSITKLSIKSCRCDANRTPAQCKASSRKMGVSVHALIAILLCILTILVIVILFVMRKHYQKDSLAHMKHSGEIHEQLVTYDEEGGGEMDTNGYDVSILTSACNDGSLLRHPDCLPLPAMYAMVQKQPPHSKPAACKGDMAAVIEMKKDEADHDRDGFPYDTLHIYGYEGPESLAGSLSSLESSSSSGSNLDYDFLNDWGPRFKALAELYGVDGADYYHQY